MDKDLHCSMCGADFATRTDLDEHERKRHTQQGISGVVPSNEYPPESEKGRTRKWRAYTRRNPE